MNRIVECTANRGKQYLVTFDDEGAPFSVVSLGNNRLIWSEAQARPMGLSAACAVRAAQKIRGEI